MIIHASIMHRVGAAVVVESGDVFSTQHYYSSLCFIQHHINNTESSHYHQVCQLVVAICYDKSCN